MKGWRDEVRYSWSSQVCWERREPPIDHSKARQVEMSSLEAHKTPGGELARKKSIVWQFLLAPRFRKGGPITFRKQRDSSLGLPNA